MKLILGDCLDKLKELPDNSVDSVVTDPPYGLSFMNKKWDYDVPTEELWREVLRVLKPGGHLLSFSGSRTYHRMAVRIEDAGFEIRDQIMWIYGSGFPKGQAQLKPAHEPIVVSRKPFKGTLKDNMEEWGTGGFNIDDCRIGYNDDKPNSVSTIREEGTGWAENIKQYRTEDWEPNNTGRWPANIMFDEEAAQVLDEQSGISKSTPDKRKTKVPTGQMFGTGRITSHNDKGGASRFFYIPKTNRKDRDEGLNEFPDFYRYADTGSHNHTLSHRMKPDTVFKNTHPTVKPTELMLYLIKLVTPKGGIVLDPFMGSGSTGKAAIRGGYDFIGIEREEEYLNISKARIENENRIHNTDL